MIIKMLGGCREVGRSAIELQGEKNFILDYGIDPDEPKVPIAPKKADAVFLSHSHLDHCGLLPSLVRKFGCPSYLTPVSADITKLLLLDSIKIARINQKPSFFNKRDIDFMKRHEEYVTFGQEIDIGKSTVKFISSGHIPGSFFTLVESEGKRILYTSDFNTNNTRLLKGADARQLKNIDVLITESTYSSRDHPVRNQVENNFMEAIKNSVYNDGVALIPSFAVGRAAELLLVIDSFNPDFPVYLDGMAKKATQIDLNYPEFLRDHKALQRAYDNVTPIGSSMERKKIVKNPCAIVTTGGCLDGGPVVQYLRHLWNDEKSSLNFTGFQIPGTAGRYLLDSGHYVTEDGMDLKLKMKINHFDFSAHSGRTDLFEFIKNVKPSKVLCVHGDNCQRFATEIRGRFGIPASAPKNGDKIKV